MSRTYKDRDIRGIYPRGFQPSKVSTGKRLRMFVEPFIEEAWALASIEDEEARGQGPDRYPALIRNSRGQVVDVG